MLPEITTLNIVGHLATLSNLAFKQPFYGRAGIREIHKITRGPSTVNIEQITSNGEGVTITQTVKVWNIPGNTDWRMMLGSLREKTTEGEGKSCPLPFSDAIQLISSVRKSLAAETPVKGMELEEKIAELMQIAKGRPLTKVPQGADILRHQDNILAARHTENLEAQSIRTLMHLSWESDSWWVNLAQRMIFGPDRNLISMELLNQEELTAAIIAIHGKYSKKS